MNPIALLLVLATVPTEANSSDALFTKLDRNQDRKVTTDEITDSQQSFFKRALRVADRNEDGALSSDELAIALTDPKPVKLPGTNVAGRLAGMDMKQTDAKKTDPKKSERPEIKPSEAKKTTDDDVKGLRAMMQQLDRNNDGKIDKDELPPRMKQFAQQMDTDNDGKIDAAEMAAAMKRRDTKK